MRSVKKNRLKVSVLVLIFLIFVRLTKGATFLDIYSFLSRPFWPGTAQKEWLQSGQDLEQKIKMILLEKDNNRLRKLLELENSITGDRVSAAVISRRTSGWWQQLEINKGSQDEIKAGNAVVGPGGLLGIIHSVTPNTSRVRLLTGPGSRVGVWVQRIERHGILIGMGTNRPKLTFLDKDSSAQVGDIVSTSPASTIVPPNLPIGVIQSLNNQALPAPYGVIQLLATPEAIDWVQIIRD